jgi:hypothetical protein
VLQSFGGGFEEPLVGGIPIIACATQNVTTSASARLRLASAVWIGTADFDPTATGPCPAAETAVELLI